MSSIVQELMSTDLVTCPPTSTLEHASRLMRDRGIGDVLVVDDDQRLTGIVTDRDLVVRCLADGASADTAISNACSGDLTTTTPDAAVDDVVRLMRQHSLRRVPVVDDGRPVGIVSLGDLAVERDPDSALGDISAAPPNS